ncbi:MAG: cell surface protein SprA, partial [Flammeovirgaceae bacterium]
MSILKQEREVLFRSISTFCIVLFFLLAGFGTALGQAKKDSVDVRTDTTKVTPAFYFKDRLGDPFSIRNSRSPLLLPLPSSIQFQMKVDTSLRYFNLTERFGDFDYRYPSLINMGSYQKYRYNQLMTDYWRGSVNPADTATTDDPDAIIPPIEIKSAAFKRLFGGDKIDLQPNGNIVLDFGGLWQRVDNPALSVRQQRQGGFNFDQQIGMNLAGKIGEKLNVNFNFDTKNTFQFEQAYNISYTAFEEDIIQEVQMGNVNFPVNNSLITGAQNLFGIKTRMRFGKLWINSVISNQRGTVETIRIKNGAQSREFEIRATEYDNNRHFFLSQFFRDNYERSLTNLPIPNSGVNVTRVVVYVTNRNNNTSDLRNMVGLLDLGDVITDRTVGALPKTDSNPNDNIVDLVRTDNENPAINNKSLQQLLSGNGVALRDANTVEAALTAENLVNGTEFVRLDNARQLNESEYTINNALGYISLNTPLRNDEALAVAYEYTYNGEQHKVGELQEDIVRLNDEAVIYLKLLRPASIQTNSIAWDLMMKNIYSLNTNQLQQNGFQCRVIYRDDDTGLDQPKLQEGALISTQQLVKVMGIDQLNPNRDRQSDGNADFVEGLTIDKLNGRVIFPTVEPFRIELEENFLDNEQELKDKYVFNDLYLRTQADARLNRTQNKYFLKGSYQSGSSSEIILPGINIAQNSVVVRAGNTMLSEGADYTVDYQFGRVRLMNQGVLSSGKEIVIQYERADLFALQTRNLMGIDLEYILNKDIRFTGTLLHFNERPVLTRVAIGNEPVKNTVFGMGVDYRGESNLLTKIANKIPGVKSKEATPITLKAEVAGLIPGSPRLIGQNGVSYIDDFESSEVPFDLTRSPQAWVLGSTPQLILDQDMIPSNFQGLERGYRRAKLSWYNIDQVFYNTAGAGQNNTRPDGIGDDDVRNQLVRAIGFNEVFPNRAAQQISFPETSFDLAYYPDERGPYNYNDNPTEWDENARMNNPEKNFGAITRAITHDVDFDNINIQYIEFWLMDPFANGAGDVNKYVRDNRGNTTGGDLYINLGNISEDVIPDNRHFFENGLTVDRSNLTESEWGYSPNQQYLTNAFGTEAGARTAQDVGFDGYNNQEEMDSLLRNLPINVQDVFANDPSADDFVHYLDAESPNGTVKILERYKNFTNPEGNSPENTTGGVVRAYTNFPENEDLNRDNTLSTIDQYYQYKVPLRPGLDIGSSFIVDKLETRAPQVGGEDGDPITWYQFRIPIRTENKTNIGGIDGFKSIRYIRMFMTGWREPVVLRMVQFQLVSAQWRPVTEFSVAESGAGPAVEPPRNIDVSSVNIEENGDLSEGTIPYDLPPGFIRDFDQTSAVTRQLNEQSLQLCIDGLEDSDGRAVFKTVSMDFINYKRLKLEVHGHSATSETDDLNVF